MASVEESSKIACEAIKTGIYFETIILIIIVEHTDILIGELLKYEDWRRFGLFSKKDYIDKWSRMIKSQDGTWKSVLIIGKFQGKIVVEIENEGILSVEKGMVFPYEKRFENMRWKKGGPSM